MSLKKWSPEMTKALVNLYELHPVLYKVDNPNYHNKVLRYSALQSIKIEMETIYKINLQESDVTKKINNLRSQFLDCLRMQRKTPASGSGAEVKSKWWLFESMQFLLPYCNKDKGKSNMMRTDTIIEKCSVSQNAEIETCPVSQISDFENNIEIDIIEDDHDYLHTDFSSIAGTSTDSELLSPPLSIIEDNVPKMTPTLKRKRKAPPTPTGLNDFAKSAISEILEMNKPSPSSQIKTFAKLIEDELASIKNEKILKKVKWGILDMVRKAQDEDDNI